MNRVLVRAVSSLAIVVLAACSSGGVQSLVPSGAADGVRLPNGDTPTMGANSVRRLCSLPAIAGRMQCSALIRTDVQAGPSVALLRDALSPRATLALGAQSQELQNCSVYFGEGYCPVDLQSAYKLPSLTEGTGRTVAIVDAYGYKNASGDLAIYRKTMGLKACTTSTGCLRIVNQAGNASPLPAQPPANDNWMGEDSLDLDMVSAVCPNCKIVMVQADNDYTNNLYAGVKTAVRLGAKYIGLSWGGPESGPDNSTFDQPGVVITAAAGDEGGGGSKGGPEQPCSYTYVVCVGGTHLVRSDDKRGWSETVWNDWSFDECGSSGDSPCGATGSGCSTKIAKPAWQTDKGCKMRSEADISASASLRAAVIVYNSELGSSGCPDNCFWLFGGTSASTQMIAGIYALAGNASTQNGASGIWRKHTGNVFDVISGHNINTAAGMTCASSVGYICTAQVGFDGPTGWGTPNGLGAF